MKNWSIDLFNQELTQELSFRVPLAEDKTKIKNGTLSFRFYIFDIQSSATLIDRTWVLCLSAGLEGFVMDRPTSPPQSLLPSFTHSILQQPFVC